MLRRNRVGFAPELAIEPEMHFASFNPTKAWTEISRVVGTVQFSPASGFLAVPTAPHKRTVEFPYLGNTWALVH
jgi:hypothetical protein